MSLGFIARNLTGRVEEFKEALHRELGAITSAMSKHGRLSSATTLNRIADASQRMLREDFASAAKFAFAVHETIDEDLIERMRGFLAKAETIIDDTLRTVAKRTGMDDKTIEPFCARTTEGVQNLSARLLDDFSFGMVGSDKLRKDPLVSVINNQTNSPGAVQQVGFDNASLQASVQNTTQLVEALRQFVDSDAVAALEPEKRVAVRDVAETMMDEAQKPKPDASKLKRWYERLVGIVVETSVRTETSQLLAAISKWLGL
jgi:hypothetical protein